MALLESSHDGIYAVDPRGVIRNWSPGAERLYGYAAHEAVGLPYTSLFPDHRHDEAAMALDCALAGEPVSLFDTEARRKDGGLVPSFLNLWPVWDRRGKVAGVSAIARDVTEETLVQEALADSQARLRDTEAMARVGHWVWDVGHGGGAVVGGPAPHLRPRPGALRRHPRGPPRGDPPGRPPAGAGRDARCRCRPRGRSPRSTAFSGPTARRAGWTARRTSPRGRLRVPWPGSGVSARRSNPFPAATRRRLDEHRGAPERVGLRSPRAHLIPGTP